MVVDFCLRAHKRLSQYSLRAQIIAYYNGIFRLLYVFPAIRLYVAVLLDDVISCC